MEDGFSQIGRMDPERVKGRLRIQYVNEAGLPEAGIDGGGLFKDFMEELLRQGFSPQVSTLPAGGACCCQMGAEVRLGSFHHAVRGMFGLLLVQYCCRALRHRRHVIEAEAVPGFHHFPPLYDALNALCCPVAVSLDG